MLKSRVISFLLCLLLIFSFTFTSYADVNDLLIGTDSNALMTMDLTDDYGISTFSTLGTVTNTLESTSRPYLVVYYYDDNGASVKEYVWPTYSDGRWSYSYTVPGIIYRINHCLVRSYGCLPSPGTYNMSFDFASDFSYEYSRMNFACEQDTDNVALETTAVNPSDYWEQFSGDLYISPLSIQLGSISAFLINVWIPTSQEISQIGGSYAWRFVKTSDAPVYTFGYDTSTSDYQDSVSSSLSEQTESIQNVADAIESLQSSMEPHYADVLTQLHHITEQLHAFWDQLYNLFFTPQYERLGEIRDAISDMNSGLGGIVSDSSAAIQAKLQSVQEAIVDKLYQVQLGIEGQIVQQADRMQNEIINQFDNMLNGYDNSGMQQDNEELSGAVDDLDKAEQEVLDDVTGYIDDFEYPSVDALPGGVLAALSFFGPYLQSVFINMGDFGIIITFSLTMIFVLILIGYHRIRS